VSRGTAHQGNQLDQADRSLFSKLREQPEANLLVDRDYKIPRQLFKHGLGELRNRAQPHCVQLNLVAALIKDDQRVYRGCDPNRVVEELRRTFLYVPDAEERIAKLELGQQLGLPPDVNNPVNPRAQQLVDHAGQSIGWLPNYLVEELCASLEALRRTRTGS